jgi:protease I
LRTEVPSESAVAGCFVSSSPLIPRIQPQWKSPRTSSNPPNHQKGSHKMDERSPRVTRRRALAASLGAVGTAAAAGTKASGAERKRKSLEGKKVLVAIGEFSEGMETYYMIYRLKEEGVVPVVAAADVKLLQLVVHDFDPQYSNYTEMRGYKIQTDIAYRDVNAADYDGLLIPGGRGPEEIRQYKEVLAIVGHFVDGKLPLGAMCHGPQVLWAARPVKGRKMTCYYGIRPDLELAGARFVDEPVVVDGPLVTSRGWPDLPDFMPQFLKVLARK